ncbi:DUF5131 family protein [Streptomyces fagopyri]|uniref:DUF5131 family protein n=1 Tax=Streptomyces fagopyri TaxID=2662397 RepID=UPI0037F3BF12
MSTRIEWADETWSPVIGCDRVSPGCTNCYAIGQAHMRAANPHPAVAAAFAGTTHKPGTGLDWTGSVNLIEERLTQPLRWKKPRRVFVNSLSDLFHDQVPDEFIAKVFAIMSLTPQHTYIILTKRHARMRSLLTGLCTCGAGHPPAVDFRSEMAWRVSKANADRIPGLPDNAEHVVYHETPWPLPNVWVGVSVEDQKRAELRIPELIKTPAAVRFVSCEPLLGPVDLTPWMPPIAPMPVEQAPATWAEWTWPDWVPARVREEIESFWGDGQGRSPRHWIRAIHEQGGTPAFGATVRMNDDPHRNRQVTGRFVYCWGNIGRLALDNDPNREYAYTSFGARTRERTRGIDWVIAGGESGHRARAMHPDWARALRDQTTAADVPLFFKQWGEWGPAPFIVRVCDPDVGWTGTNEELVAAKTDSEARGASHVHTGNWHEENGDRIYELHEIGHKPWSLERVGLPDGMAAMRRWGKKTAGRELDGRTWDEYPKAARP